MVLEKKFRLFLDPKKGCGIQNSNKRYGLGYSVWLSESWFG